jgi:hypothetical protein
LSSARATGSQDELIWRIDFPGNGGLRARLFCLGDVTNALILQELRLRRVSKDEVAYGPHGSRRRDAPLRHEELTAVAPQPLPNCCSRISRPYRVQPIFPNMELTPHDCDPWIRRDDARIRISNSDVDRHSLAISPRRAPEFCLKLSPE